MTSRMLRTILVHIPCRPFLKFLLVSPSSCKVSNAMEGFNSNLSDMFSGTAETISQEIEKINLEVSRMNKAGIFGLKMGYVIILK